jgi:hypothetical protein
MNTLFAGIMLLVLLVSGIYILILATRLVKAIEKIAD